MNEPFGSSVHAKSFTADSRIFPQATILHPQDPPQKDLSRSCAETKTSANRPASPATSVDLRSSIADEDCECFIEELRTPNIRVPRQLPRPAIVQEMDYSNLQLDPSLKDVPMPYILDNITLKGSALLSTVVQSSIALPSSSSLASTPPSRPAIPRTVAVRTPLRLLDQAALPEYVLAVTNDETDKVMFLPVHGLVLAASSKSFAGLAQPPTVDTPSTEEGEDTIRISPVVHIHLPSSAAFSRLVPFFYTQDSGSLLASLLPLQHLPNMSLHAAQSSPSLLADHLAQLDQQLLTQYVYLNHSMWRTAVALGAGRDELWKVLQASWVALVTALSVQHSKSRVKIEDSKSSSPI